MFQKQFENVVETIQKDTRMLQKQSSNKLSACFSGLRGESNRSHMQARASKSIPGLEIIWKWHKTWTYAYNAHAKAHPHMPTDPTDLLVTLQTLTLQNDKLSVNFWWRQGKANRLYLHDLHDRKKKVIPGMRTTQKSHKNRTICFLRQRGQGNRSQLQARERKIIPGLGMVRNYLKTV